MNTAISTTCQVMSNIAIVNNMTAQRAKVIAFRTNSIDNGIVKAAMINELKTKLANGIAHFAFVKKNGEIREAWGTTMGNIASEGRMEVFQMGNTYQGLLIECITRVGRNSPAHNT